MAIETQKIESLPTTTKEQPERGKIKMYLIKTRRLDLQPEQSEGFVQFIANGKLTRIPEDEEYWATEQEVDGLRHAIAIEHRRTETPDRHQVIVKKPVRRYELTILSEKYVGRDTPDVVQFSEVKPEETLVDDKPRDI